MRWKDYFKMMIDWKKLPAYRTEPRIDSFIGFFLNEILNEFLTDKIIDIIPEFPIRQGTLKPELENSISAERSYKVDFFAIGSNGINYLVEFKTDSRSRNKKQDEYLKKSKQLGTTELINRIQKIAKISSYKTKYNHLLNKLKNVSLLDENSINNKLEIIYIQPSNPKNKRFIIDFNWISDWLDRINDDCRFEKELAIALRNWSSD